MTRHEENGFLELAAVILLAFVMAAGLLCIAITNGCGYGATTCAVVDVAKTVCDTTPIRYMDEQGNEQTEQVPTDQIRNLAKRTRMQRLQPDAGAP